MKNFYRNDGPRGRKPGNSFGNRGPWERRDNGRDEGRVVMHSATCNECGNDCEVPFKPNGRKPVLCSNCFKRDGGRDGGFRSDDRGNGFERKSYGASSFGEKRSFAPAAAACKCKDYSEEIEMLNAKLDAILGILTEAMGEEEGDMDDEEVVEGEVKA